MCFNLETSIITFSISSLVSYKLYKRRLKNDLILLNLILCYNIVQLSEFIIWLSIKYEQKKLNVLGTLILCISLHFHSLSIILGYYADMHYCAICRTDMYYKGTKFKILSIINIIYVLVYSISTYQHYVYKNIYSFTSFPHKKYNNLIWDINDNNYKYTFLLCIITIVSLMRPFKLTLFVAMYYIFLAIVVYSYSNVTFGSLWCWISSFLSVFVYFINKLIK